MLPDRKQPASVVSIDSARITPSDQPPTPANAAFKRKSSSTYAMSRRTFAGLFFGMGMGTWKAARKAGITPSMADDEIRAYGYDAWARATGRKTA